MYKIIDIKHKETNQTRTDGRYPLRIGSVIEFYIEPTVNQCGFLVYIYDNKGNSRDGVLRTSIIDKIEYSENKMIITTCNSIYILEKCREE